MTAPPATPAPALLRVAAAQAVSVPEGVEGHVETNVATSVDLVDRAADQGVRVLVLPELFLTGYAPETWTHDGSITPDDERLAPLAAAASATGVVVVVGAASRRALDESTIAALVVDPAGGVRVAYDKQQLDPGERAFFTPGTRGASLDVDGWRLGLGVCYDGCFPEHARAAALDGASAYLCPAAYSLGSEHRRELYYSARALDNGMYVVLSGLTGRCGVGELSGGSAVYDPEGRPLGRLGTEAPALVVADLDPAVVVGTREAHRMLDDVRGGRVSESRTVLRVGS